MKLALWCYGVAVFVVVGASLLGAAYPHLLVAVPVVVLATYAITRPLGRIAVFAGGALAVFQSSSGASASKLVFFAITLVAVIIAIHRCASHLKTDWGAHFRRPLHGALLIVALVFVAGLTGTLVGGVPVTEAARDGVTYLLIAAAVPLAIDGASTMTRRSVDWVIVLVTATAAVSFAVLFLAARGVSTLSVERIGLASMMALSIGVSVGFVRGLAGKGVRFMWLLYVALLLACVLVTGSRGGLVLLAAVVGIVGGASHGGVPVTKLIFGLVASALGLLAALVITAPSLTSAGFLESRINATLVVINEGSGQDLSGSIRARATAIAIEAWQSSPFFGVGLGHQFPDPTPGGYLVDFQVDSAATFLAKFGLLGTAILFAALALIISPAFSVHGDTGRRIPEQAMVRGALAVWITTLIFGAPTEDKGFSLAVLMCLLVLGSAVRASAPTPSDTARDALPLPGLPQRQFASRNLS